MRHTKHVTLIRIVGLSGLMLFLLRGDNAKAQTATTDNQATQADKSTGFRPPTPLRSANVGYPLGTVPPLPEGTATLWIIVNERGGVDSALVVKPLTAELNNAATSALSNWQFEPATDDGVAVPSRVTVDVTFRTPEPSAAIRLAIPVAALDDTRIAGAYRVGGGVTPPRPIYAPDPEYTRAALDKKVHGRVLLWLIVGANGLPRNVRVVNSLDPDLDQMALDAVKQWRFDPALANGKPVPVMINVEVNYKLPK